MTPNASMAGNVRGIDHIGITVPDVEEATRFLSIMRCNVALLSSEWNGWVLQSRDRH